MDRWSVMEPNRMDTKILLERNGKITTLYQPATASGLPRCVYCQKPIPKSYRDFQTTVWKRALFCCDKHALYWAMWAAVQVFPAVSPRPNQKVAE